VQLTLWDQFDLGGASWGVHPWNPANNVTMPADTWASRADFYATVAAGDQLGLTYQHRFVDEILAVTLAYDNVLYNINNESSEGTLWENYWAQHIKRTAAAAGRTVFVTTMQFDPASSVRHVLTFRDIFDYAEISQNNQDSRGARGPGHHANILYWREMISASAAGPMPMNNVKVYGGGAGENYSAGTELEAIHRFWRNIFAGCASSRFHRPAAPALWGSGLNERVRTNLTAMRMLLAELDLFSCRPDNDLLSHPAPVRAAPEAYVMACIGKQYAVYFPAGRYAVQLDPWVYAETLRLRWLDIEDLSWTDPELVPVRWDGGLSDWGYRGTVPLTTPGNRPCVALLDLVDVKGK
jgi:hypothetical protein